MSGKVEDMSIMLNGKSDRLINIDGAQHSFRLQNDPNWKVTRVIGSNTDPGVPDNDDNNNEAFKVETPDGTTYWFGWGRATDSVWTVPVYGNDTGEQCHDTTTASSWCQQGWRWNLDLVEDALGNKVKYEYATETNYYSRWAVSNTANRTQYDRGGYLTKIRYGFARNETDLARQVVAVDVLDRCTDQLTNPSANCSGSNGPRAKPNHWPDVPSDLICDNNGTCDNAAPSFFSTKRYYRVTTKTVEGTNSPGWWMSGPWTTPCPTPTGPGTTSRTCG